MHARGRLIKLTSEKNGILKWQVYSQNMQLTLYMTLGRLFGKKYSFALHFSALTCMCYETNVWIWKWVHIYFGICVYIYTSMRKYNCNHVSGNNANVRSLDKVSKLCIQKFLFFLYGKEMYDEKYFFGFRNSWKCLFFYFIYSYHVNNILEGRDLC